MSFKSWSWTGLRPGRRRKRTSSNASTNRLRPAVQFEHLEDRRLLAQIAPAQAGGTSLTTGGIDFLYIRANTDSRQTTQTEAAITTIRDSADAYYQENSGGRAFIDSFDITPVYDLPQTFSSLGQLESAFRQAAIADGYNLSDYSRIAFGFPNAQFPFGGGALGSGNSNNGTMYIPDGVFNAGLDSALRGIIHESLHTLGLGHANDYEFHDQIIRNDHDLTETISLVSVGGIDPYHFMGGEADAGLEAGISTYHRYYIGWLNQSHVTVAPDDPTGVYRIYDYTEDTSPEGEKVVLQVGSADGDNGVIWLSYDAEHPGNSIVSTGVIAHFVDPIRPAVSLILDLTPDSRDTYDPGVPGDEARQRRDDFYDAAGVVGESYAIPAPGIDDFVFTPLTTGSDANGNWVDIQVVRAEVADIDQKRLAFQLDLGPEDQDIQPGYFAVSPIAAGEVAWTGSVTGVSRSGGDALTRDYITADAPATLDHTVRNGVWHVTVQMGDLLTAHDEMGIRAEGTVAAAGIDSAAGEFATAEFDVTVTDGSLSLEFFDDGGSDASWVVNSVSLEQVERLVDLNQDLYTYDIGGENSEVVTNDFLDPDLLTAKAAGDIYWTGPIVADADVAQVVVDGEIISVGDLRSGLDAQDSASGLGFILYSEEPVATRLANPPAADNATNLLIVRQAGGNLWQYSTADAWVGFMPDPIDRLIAQVSFSFDIVQSLEDQRGVVGGIQSGYDSGNLFFFADRFGGTVNEGEFQVSTNEVSLPAGDAVLRDGILASGPVTLNHALENGVWRVSLQMSGSTTETGNLSVIAEGSTALSGLGTTGGQVINRTFDVMVEDGSLTLDFIENGGIEPNLVLHGMTLERIGVLIDTSVSHFAYDAGGIYGRVEPGFDLLSEKFVQGDVRFDGGSLDYRDRHNVGLLDNGQPEFRDFLFGQGSSNRTLEHKVSDGTWRVTLVLSEPLFPNRVSNARIEAENKLIASGLSNFWDTSEEFPKSNAIYVSRSGGSTERASFDVEVTDGSLTLEMSNAWRLASVELEKVGSDLGGDYNFDGIVDAADYTVWRDSLDAIVPANTGADGDGSGVVDAGDYTVWRSNYGASTAPAVAAISSAPSITSDADISARSLAVPSVDDVQIPISDVFPDELVLLGDHDHHHNTHSDFPHPNEIGGCGCGGIGCSACVGTSESPIASEDRGFAFDQASGEDRGETTSRVATNAVLNEAVFGSLRSSESLLLFDVAPRANEEEGSPAGPVTGSESDNEVEAAFEGLAAGEFGSIDDIL